MVSLDTIKSQTQWALLFSVILGLEIMTGFGLLLHPFIPVALISMITIIIVALINPNIGIAVLIFSIPFAAAKFNMNITEILTFDTVHVMLFCLVFLYLITKGKERELQFSKSPIDIYYPIFLSWAMLSLIWAPHFFNALAHLFALVMAFLLYYITCFAIQNEKSLEYVIWGWWSVGIIFFFLAIMQYFSVVKMDVSFTMGILEGYSRVTGLSGSPSAFARIMILVFFAMLGAYHLFENNIKKALVRIALLCSLLVIVLTLSRSGFIGLFAGLFLYSLRFVRHLSVKHVIFIFLLGVAFFVFGFLVNINFMERIESIFNFYKQGAWIIRLSVWSAAYEMFMDTYGLGVGLGGFEALFKLYFDPPFRVGNVPPHTHSIYMDLLTHFGVIGFILLAAMMVKLVFYLYQLLKRLEMTGIGKALLAFCCGLLSSFIQNIISGLVHISEIWVYMGMIVACAKIAEKQLESKNQ